MPLVRKPAGGQPTASPVESASIRDALSSADPDQRWSAARAASSSPEDAAALEAALRIEKAPHVREAMFTSLGRMGIAESTTALLGLLRSDDSALRTGALDVLRLKDGPVLDVLPHLLADSDLDVRLLSCELARTLPGDQATALLCGLLDKETHVNVCAAAVEVLAEVGTPAARPTLERCTARFQQNPFLTFAIKVAIDRIAAQSAPARV